MSTTNSTSTEVSDETTQDTSNIHTDSTTADQEKVPKQLKDEQQEKKKRIEEEKQIKQEQREKDTLERQFKKEQEQIKKDQLKQQRIKKREEEEEGKQLKRDQRDEQREKKKMEEESKKKKRQEKVSASEINAPVETNVSQSRNIWFTFTADPKNPFTSKQQEVDKIVGQIKSLITLYDCFILQHELDKEKKIHYHGYIYLVSPMRLSTMRTIFEKISEEIQGGRVNSQFCRSKNSVIKYILKDYEPTKTGHIELEKDTDLESFLEKNANKKSVEKSKTGQTRAGLNENELMEKVVEFMDRNNYSVGYTSRTIYEYKDGKYSPITSEAFFLQMNKDTNIQRDYGISGHKLIKDHINTTTMYEVPMYDDNVQIQIKYRDWQQFIDNIIRENIINDRVIHWIFDERGSIGKTYMCNALSKKYNICILTTTNEASALRVISNHKSSKGEPNVIIFDIARDTSIDSIYSLIEDIKSRNATSTKYDSAPVEFRHTPTVIVLSNRQPDVQKLTNDRWAIYVPSFSNNTFDFAFVGSLAKEGLDSHKELEDEKRIIAMEHEKVYETCFPLVNIKQIEHFDLYSPHLKYYHRKKYWDKHEIPIYTLEAKPSRSSIAITSRPMTEMEIQDYENSKISTTTGDMRTMNEIKKNEALRRFEKELLSQNNTALVS